jgi:hypothetical protein
MVVANNKIDETKSAGKSTSISMAMAMQWYNAVASTERAHLELYSKPLDAAVGQVLAPYRPDGRHGHRI